MKRIYFSILLGVFSCLAFIGTAFGSGFGISPSQIQERYLMPGSKTSVYIEVSRSDVRQQAIIDVKKDLGQANDWVIVNNNKSIVLSPRENKVQVPITINIPKSLSENLVAGQAMDFTGSISFSERQLTVGQNSAVNIGSQIKVLLGIIDAKVSDISPRHIELSSAFAQKKWLFFSLPGQIKFSLDLDNAGNQMAGLDMLSVRIYDKSEKILLQTINYSRAKKIAPFTRSFVELTVPAYLDEGEYVFHAYAYANGSAIPALEQRMLAKVSGVVDWRVSVIIGLKKYWPLAIIAFVIFFPFGAIKRKFIKKNNSH
ncbi:MAG: hypothetical protein ABH832_02775 [bacterium]